MALTNHKYLIYLKTQDNLSRLQASWLETLQQYPMRIKYKSGIKLKFASSLYRFYIRRSIGTKDVEPNWPMLLIRNKNAGLLAGITEATKAMVLITKMSLPTSTVPWTTS